MEDPRERILKAFDMIDALSERIHRQEHDFTSCKTFECRCLNYIFLLLEEYGEIYEHFGEGCETFSRGNE